MRPIGAAASGGCPKDLLIPTATCWSLQAAFAHETGRRMAMQHAFRTLGSRLAVLIALAAASPLHTQDRMAQQAQQKAPQPTEQSAPQTQQTAQKKPFKPEELEQLMAPIALYPDALLAQVLMASTYPIEVVEAARWSKANPNLKG